MNLEYEIVYVKNKEYIYVLTINVDNDNVLDLSIFEIEEWTHLTKISKVFEDAVVNLDVEISLRPYINVSKDIKKCAYYLYYSPFCWWKGFNDLECETLEINDIYKVVFDLVKEDTNIKVNVNIALAKVSNDKVNNYKFVVKKLDDNYNEEIRQVLLNKRNMDKNR